MPYAGPIFAGTLGNINIGAAGALSVLNPLLLQLDLSLFGSLGIGDLSASLALQLQAALALQLDIGLGLTGLGFSIDAVLTAIASLQASLLAGITLPSLDLSLSLGASLALSASIAAQIGGLQVLIEAAIALKIPATTLAGQLEAALGAGPVFVVAWDNIPLSAAGSGISSDFTTGLTLGPNNIAPGDISYGVLLVTKAPTAFAGMQVLLLTS